jgi:CheY-like chemotaxis protein
MPARILLMEDNSSDVFLLRRALTASQGENFELEIAADGERALQFIDKLKENPEAHPCVIVLDLHLPKHDGLEVLRAIQRKSDLNHIQVVVTTNAASPTEAEELRQMGVHYRLKPKNLMEFDKLAADLIAICNG